MKAALLIRTGSLSEEGLLVYLRVLQAFLSQLPVTPAGASYQDSPSDSEDESEEAQQQTSVPVSRTVAGWQVWHSEGAGSLPLSLLWACCG